MEVSESVKWGSRLYRRAFVKGELMVDNLDHLVFKKDILPGGMRIYVAPTSRFTTTKIHVYFHRDIRVNPTHTALLPVVLRRGSQTWQSIGAIRRRFASLCSSKFGVDVERVGFQHLTSFRVEFLNSEWSDEDLLEPILSTLADILLNPVLENGLFFEDNVRAGLESSRMAIMRLNEVKLLYARAQCLEILLGGSQWIFNPFGTLKELDSVTCASLYAHYLKFLYTSSVTVLAIGPYSLSSIATAVNEYFDPIICHMKPTHLPSGTLHKKEDVRIVQEAEGLSQTRICVAYRTGIRRSDSSYWALALMCALVGEIPQSMLNMTIRDKAGLGYYATSSLESNLGIMLIETGVEPHGVEMAINLISQVIKQLNTGQFSIDDFSSAKQALLGRLLWYQDSPGATIHEYVEAIVAGYEENISNAISKIRNLTSGDIVEISSHLELDTVYYLGENN